MAYASSGIGTFIGSSAYDPVAQGRPNDGLDTSTLLLFAAAALVVLLILKRV